MPVEVTCWISFDFTESVFSLCLNLGTMRMPTFKSSLNFKTKNAAKQTCTLKPIQPQAVQRAANGRLIGLGQRNCGLRLACLNGHMNLRLKRGLRDDVDTRFLPKSNQCHIKQRIDRPSNLIQMIHRAWQKGMVLFQGQAKIAAKFLLSSC